jgi:hypothetical protein
MRKVAIDVSPSGLNAPDEKAVVDAEAAAALEKE